MNNTIKCKYCGKELEITEALQHHLVEKALSEQSIRHKKELEEKEKQAEQIAFQRLQKDFEYQIKLLQKEKDEEKERNKKLLKQLEDLSEEIRALRRKDEERDLEMKKQIFEREEKTREEARKKFLEEHELKDREKDKKLADMLKQIDELKAKAQQSSQQTQGEVMELELEDTLRKKFPNDILSEVKKGIRGADVLQEVIDKKGRKCGLILWESKNAQWSETWIKKLREDQREAKAQTAVLVLANPPDDITSYVYRDGIWITVRKLTTELALSLRYYLIRVQYEKLANIGKNEKTEVLYQYIRSTEFIHKIEAIMDYFKNRRDEVEKEKRYFTTKWARQEKELSNILNNTYGMYGELQAVTGKELPEIKLLEPSDE